MSTDKEAGWRKAVIATLISVVLSPIGIGFGWYLSYLLARLFCIFCISSPKEYFHDKRHSQIGFR